MHAVNPIIFLLIYLYFTKLKLSGKKEYMKRVFLAPTMLTAYAAFDFIRFLITVELVYGLIAADKLNYISVPLIGIVLYFLMAFMSYGLLELKLRAQKRMKF